MENDKEDKWLLIAMAALILAAGVAAAGVYFLQGTWLLTPLDGVNGFTPFGVYALVAALVSIVAFAMEPKHDNIIGSVMVAFILGWIYWPFFIRAMVKLRRRNLEKESQKST